MGENIVYSFEETSAGKFMGKKKDKEWRGGGRN